ncbi:neutral/alkaline non-lysosomal ceramidase N-terminal domain-containing protein [Planococcus maritimus]|nr:neutral/alkaline non-lysosomal ceramidase N-terminal domain-containing protein [Planococcus sp. SK3692]MDE4085287.1 neutral/alkaline non-lysosomal ceramidase N-terminal domain-containing protein [Planococcus maritimus]
MSATGVYTVDITPSLGMEFIGYHRENGIQNTDERIYATAIVFESAENKTVLISIDNIGMLIEDTDEIRKQTADALKLTTNNIMVAFTHTHSGPATAGNNPAIKAYRDQLISNAVKAAVLADKEKFTSEIGWKVSHADLGVNRRERTANGKVKMGVNDAGAVDPRIGLMAIRNGQTQQIGGLVIFCTAHPNVLKGESEILSADYPGRARQLLQKSLDCPVVVVQGAAGNVNAKHRGSVEALNKMGVILSECVLKMFPEVQFKPIFSLECATAELPMRLKDIPVPEKIHEIADLTEVEWGVKTEKWRNALTDMHNQSINELEIDLELQLFQINEGAFSGIPMESFVETAIELKNEVKNELFFFGGYTNGYLGYLPIKEAYPEGGYEVELNPVVYGPITNLWMPPEESTSEQVVNKVKELYKSVQPK